MHGQLVRRDDGGSVLAIKPIDMCITNKVGLGDIRFVWLTGLTTLRSWTNLRVCSEFGSVG